MIFFSGQEVLRTRFFPSILSSPGAPSSLSLLSNPYHLRPIHHLPTRLLLPPSSPSSAIVPSGIVPPHESRCYAHLISTATYDRLRILLRRLSLSRIPPHLPPGQISHLASFRLALHFFFNLFLHLGGSFVIFTFVRIGSSARNAKVTRPLSCSSRRALSPPHHHDRPAHQLTTATNLHPRNRNPAPDSCLCSAGDTAFRAAGCAALQLALALRRLLCRMYEAGSNLAAHGLTAPRPSRNFILQPQYP